MKVRDEFETFAGDQCRQMHLLQDWQRIISEWQNSEEGRKVEALFADAAALDTSEAITILRPLLENTEWLERSITAMISCLERDKFFNPSVPKMRNAILDGLVLVESEQLTLSLSVLDHQKLKAIRRASKTKSKIISFSAGYRVLKFLKAGGLRVSEFQREESRDGAAPYCKTSADLHIFDGDMIAYDNDKQSLYFEDAESDALILQISFKATGDYVREFDGISGQQCLIATHDDAAARTQMMLGLLDVLKPKGAGACFEEALQSDADDQRWQAMRQYLAFDAEPAAARLQAMVTNDPSPDVRQIARKTLSILQQSHASLFPAAPNLYGPKRKKVSSCP